MDKQIAAVLKAITQTLDMRSVQTAAIVAILGAIIEKIEIDPSRVDAWCRAVSQQGELGLGVSYAEVRAAADDLLRGLGRSQPTRT